MKRVESRERLVRCLGLRVLVMLVLLSPIDTARGQVSALVQSTREYARAIAAVQDDLEKGRPSVALEKLAATNEALRSFEYAYLRARAQAADPDGKSPDLMRVIAAPDVAARYGVFDAVNQQLVYICRDGKLRVFALDNAASDPQVVDYQQGGSIWSGAFSRDGSTFATGHENGEVVVWDAATWKQRHVIPLGKRQPVREIAVAPDGSALVAEGPADMELWSLGGDKPAKVAAVGERYNFGEGLAFSPQGNLLATGGMFDIHLHNVQTGELVRSIHHASYTMGLQFSPDGHRIASAPRGNVNKVLAVFDVAQGNQLSDAGPFECYVHGLAFSSDGKRVVGTACDKIPAIQFYDAATGELVFVLSRSEPGVMATFSPDGRMFGWSESSGYRLISL
ncbi:MAG: hypothetical protein KDA60_00370 [Planctomycetales bacterium]|nr:hypothetical protein [Planctomycetales bacterium]